LIGFHFDPALPSMTMCPHVAHAVEDSLAARLNTGDHNVARELAADRHGRGHICENCVRAAIEKLNYAPTPAELEMLRR